MVERLDDFTRRVGDFIGESVDLPQLTDSEKARLEADGHTLNCAVEQLKKVFAEHSPAWGPYQLWIALSAAFYIGAYGIRSPTEMRLKKESMASARAQRCVITDDDLLSLAVPHWNGKSPGATAKAILAAHPSLDVKANTLEKRLRPLMKKLGF